MSLVLTTHDSGDDMNQVGIQTVREWFKPYGNSRMVKPFRNNLTRMRILANPITNVETVREWFEPFANGSNRLQIHQIYFWRSVSIELQRCNAKVSTMKLSSITSL